MKKFKYKLDPLLKIRKFQEKKEYANYALILSRVNKLQAEIKETSDQHQDLMRKQTIDMQNGIFDLNETLIVQEFKDKLGLIKDASQKKIDSMKTEFESLRKTAETARKNRRILEILREKKFREFQYEVDKNEFKQIDEFNQRKKRKEVFYE